MTDRSPKCPFAWPAANRRQVLLGFGGGAAALAGPRAALAREGDDQVTDAPSGTAELQEHQPFHGMHQAGVTTPRPAAGLVAAFTVVAQTPAELEAMLRRLSERIAFLMRGGPVPEVDPSLPPADSGILGPVVEPDNLTVTVALGASLFEGREWLKGLKPLKLHRMEQFPNDALDGDICHGDLSMQFCANLQDTNIHALRDIVKTLSDFLVLRWSQEGSVPVVPPQAGGHTESARNFLGFHDGSANPDSSEDAVMDRVVWVGPDAGEPEWAVGGSYQVVRVIRNFVERWDRTPLGEQEEIVGRQKMSGAPLGAGPDASERDEPDYASDADGTVTPLDAHIRRANPRTPETRDNLILRRPFNYTNGVASNGQLDQGLLLIVYQADLEKGFITVQKRLNGEPLEEYIKPVGGGYFYVLPGAKKPGDYLGKPLIEAIRGPSQPPS